MGMREILFRGKRLCLNEWVEGYFLMAKMYRFDEELCEYISVPHPKVEGMPSDNFLVDPDTVGQFTGLTDKNGKKIFEGDIIKWDAAEWGEEYCEPVVWDYSFFSMRQDDWQHFCEVIGNIHDNPELLRRDGNG